MPGARRALLVTLKRRAVMVMNCGENRSDAQVEQAKEPCNDPQRHGLGAI
jgi:hypothetical protein